MMQFTKWITTLTLSLLLASCAFAPPVVMPSNVVTRPGTAQGAYLDSVDLSYKSEKVESFKQLMLCVAENVTNRAVNLHDSSGSFVGPSTGHYYQTSNGQTVQGGDVFKYSDESLSTLIATGTADGGPVAYGLTRDVVSFDLKAAVHDKSVTLLFSNITRAMLETGSGTNDGFGPVGTWEGAHPMQIYGALEATANKIKACL